MKRYVLANIKIPVVINENGLFDMLNEYTQTEITSLNELPEIEGEDNLYKKIIEFLENKKDDLEEPVQKIKIKDCIEEEDEEEIEEENEEEGSEENEEEGSEENEKEGSEEGSEKMCNSTMEQVMTICKNNIKMRKHSNNMTFKNIKNCKKGVKSYTRKTYE
jgi:flagellar biosynthesis/type III secretory pathway protein FliH